MSENRFTKNLRATVVTQSYIYSTFPGDAFHPPEHLFPTPELSVEQAKGEVWHLHLTLKTGFDKSSLSISYFGDFDAARKALSNYPVGKEIAPDEERFRLDFKDLFKNGSEDLLGLLSAGGDEMFLCYEVLDGAGLRENRLRPTPEILDWHGEEKLVWLKQTFGDNWCIAADLEYCLNHFPSGSMVVVACKARFNFFIQEDDYSAGYFFRELELLHGGAEQMAADAVDLRKKAGKGGSKASQAAKAKRLNQFMSEIEGLGDLFPRVSEQAILDQAFLNAVDANAESWKQGLGQKEQYATELRSDPDFRKRYYNVFPKTA